MKGGSEEHLRQDKVRKEPIEDFLRLEKKKIGATKARIQKATGLMVWIVDVINTKQVAFFFCQ